MQLHSFFSKAITATLLLAGTLFPAAAQPGCQQSPTNLVNGELTMAGLGNMNSSGPTTVNAWYVSHGSPSTGAPAPGGGSNGIWMWSYNGRGEGIYSCYRFEAGQTYRICLWVQNTRNSDNNPGNLMIYAANGLNGNGPGSTTIAVPSSSQLISSAHNYSANWIQLSYTFTANANYNQLWIYPYRSGPSIAYLQYELNLDRIQCGPAGAGEECGTDIQPCNAKFKTTIPGFYLNGSPTRTFTVDQYFPNATYTWDIDGQLFTVSSNSFTMDFTPGIHKVCLTVTMPNGEQCRFCQTFCVIIEEFEAAEWEGQGQKPGTGQSGIVQLTGAESKAYKLYPNPAGNELSLEYYTNSSEKVMVQLVDMTGRVLKTQEAQAQQGNNVIRIDTRSLSAGSYAVKIEGGGSSKTLAVSIVK